MALASNLFDGVDEAIENDGTVNGSPPVGQKLRDISDGLNTAACRGRTLLAIPVARLSDSPSANGTTNVWRFRYDQRNQNGRKLDCRAVFVTKDDTLATASGVLEFRDETAAVTTTLVRSGDEEVLASITWPDDLLSATGIVNYPAPAGVVNILIRVVDGFRLMGLCILERPGGGWGSWPTGSARLATPMFLVEPDLLRPGRRIVTTGASGAALVDLRETSEDIFHRVRDVYNFHQPGTLAANALSVTSVSPVFTNIVDGSVARTAQTWGVPVSSIRGGYGNRAVVECTCRVYAECTDDLAIGRRGRVRFVSSLGTVESPDIGAVGWYDVATKLTVDTDGGIDGLGRDWDKVDIQAALTSGPGTDLVRVWGWGVDINPD